MEIKILEERTNPLLKRHEVRFEVSHVTAATPTRDSVRSELAKAVHAAKDRVIIERMRPRFGTAVTRGEANVYDNAEAAKQITREHILVRNGLKEKPAKGAAAAAPEAPKTEGSAVSPPAAKEAPAPEPTEAKPSSKAEEPVSPSTPEPSSSASTDAPKRAPRAHAKKE